VVISEKMSHPFLALLYFFVTIETAQADESLKRLKTLLRSSAPGLEISDQALQSCMEINLKKDCHSVAAGGRCVFCPDSLMLGLDEDEIESTGACYPAAIYGIACPRRRRVDEKEE